MGVYAYDDDLIRRGDLKHVISRLHTGGVGLVSLEDALDAITNAPAVDAVEVVRCKDCKFYRKNICPMWCYTETRPNSFCSFGERRTDGENK